MKKVITSVLFLVIAHQLLAQESPEPRDHHAMTFDNARKRIVMFGGNGSGESKYFSDLWELDNTSWRKVNESEMTERSSHAIVFIPNINKNLLIGGISKSGEYLIDMGFWDGKSWTPVAEGPSPRYSPAIAYDEFRETLVLFSGAGRGEDEMWEWKDGVWTQISLNQENRPLARTRSQMVYDYVRKTVILFGGYAEGKSVDDMWEWNGKEWTRLQVNVPPARNNHLMVSDKHRKHVVLFGGKNRQEGILFGDTWEWNGEAWSRLSKSGPEARDMTSGAFDENGRRIVLFGGRNEDRKKLGDLWSWDGRRWSQLK
ncbi:MAG: kelch repeat-containing protein [Ekhidna sp.]